jgi:hypothetical protein
MPFEAEVEARALRRSSNTETRRNHFTKYNIFLSAEHFLVLEAYDPRIHALYYCPQLYRYDGDKRLAPLEGEEIGKLVAQTVGRMAYAWKE